MNARGFHADARGPAPAQLAFGSDARGGLGGDDFYVGVRPAAGEIDHPAFRHVGHAAAIGREPAFRGLRNETGRGTEISGGTMLGGERHVGVDPEQEFVHLPIVSERKTEHAAAQIEIWGDVARRGGLLAGTHGHSDGDSEKWTVPVVRSWRHLKRRYGSGRP